MIERLQVTAGPGTVIRYGWVVAWVSSSASPALIRFLAESARNLADSPVGGEELADHLAGVLERRDPEPHVPFAVVGASEDGWAGLVHGPAQLWDGVRWIAASPHPGWLRCAIWPQPSVTVTVTGAAVPPVSPDALWDLEAGVVPGGGFVLLPAVPAAPDPGGPAARQGPGQEMPPDIEVAGGTTPAGAQPDEATSPPKTVAAVEEEATSPADQGLATAPRPPGLVDLRSSGTRSRVVAYPPLPAVSSPPRPVPGAPIVTGAGCTRGHLNRPGMRVCARCARPIDADGAYGVSGTRPALGCLVVDGGFIYRLDSGYLVGSDPARDPTVRSRLARPLLLTGAGLAAAHAEIRLHDWDVLVTDRASETGTFVFEEERGAWERLRPYDPWVLKPGAHLAFGQAVATFVTAWIPSGREQVAERVASASSPGAGAATAEPAVSLGPEA